MVRYGISAACLFLPVIFVGAEPVAEPKPGIIFVVGGISGMSPTGQSTKVAVAGAGLPHEVRDFFWTHGKGHLLRDLQDYRHAQHKSKELAAMIREERERDPERRIWIVAKSGGAGIALQAAEELPERSLERIVLLSAAVSADYDLRPALRTAHHGIVSFHSNLDQVALNWGTRSFGTIDRHYAPSAGLKGFEVPVGLSDDDSRLYERLVQIPWEPAMMLTGYAGGHFGNGYPMFIRMHVAKWLR